MTTIKGHTVGSDGIVYDPDSAGFGYVGALDSRNTEERRAEYVAAYAPSPGGGGAGPGSPAVATGPKPVAVAGPVRSSAGSGAGSRLVVTNMGYKPGFSPGRIDWHTPLAFSDAPEIDGVANQPLKRIGIGGHNEAPGAISDLGWARTATGYIPVPSSDLKERIEDNFWLETGWFARNYLAPMFLGGNTENPAPPAFMDPKYTHYIPGLNEYREGGSPRMGADGVRRFTGGGF